jgi:hypothetical protein
MLIWVTVRASGAWSLEPGASPWNHRVSEEEVNRKNKTGMRNVTNFENCSTNGEEKEKQTSGLIIRFSWDREEKPSQ